MVFGYQFKKKINSPGKNKKKELKLAVSYTGWRKRNNSKKEYVVEDKAVCASFDNSTHFKKLAEAEIYNVDEINTRVLNGDGASWIKKSCEEQDIHFQKIHFISVRQLSEK